MITWTALLAIIRALIREDTNAFSDADALHAVNASILSVHGELFVPLAPVAIDVTTGTSAYDVPADFVYIDEIRDSTGLQIPDYAWEFKVGTTPQIVFKTAYFTPTTGSDPVVCGMGIQAVLSAGGDTLNIDPGYIQYRTLANIHSAIGGTASDVAAWHQAESERLAALAEARLADEFVLAKYRPKPDARLVPGRVSGVGVTYSGYIPDPGDAEAISVTISGYCALTSTGAETRTIAGPSFIGQEIDIYIDTYAGAVTVTSAVPINVANNNTMILGAASERILLRGVSAGGTKEWSVVANDGVALSTV